MPIRQYIPEHGCFDPEAIAAMSRAFEEACNALRLRADDQQNRELIAARIIDLARGGVDDAAALRDHVLLETHSVA